MDLDWPSVIAIGTGRAWTWFGACVLENVAVKARQQKTAVESFMEN